MKIRTGFISNSSSSSFIVSFDKIPKTKGELKDMLWGNKRVIAVYNKGETTDVLIEKVWGQFEKVIIKPITTFEEFVEEIKSGWFDGYPEHNYDLYSKPVMLATEFRKKFSKNIYDYDKKNKEQVKMYKEYKIASDEEYAEVERRVDEAAKEFAKTHWHKFEGKTTLVFSFSDDSTIGSILEHGNTFARVNHLRISHH